MNFNKQNIFSRLYYGTSQITLRHKISECTIFCGRDGQNNSLGFIFAGAVMFDVINFRGKSKNEQNREILYTRKFSAAKVRLLTSMDRKTSLHR